MEIIFLNYIERSNKVISCEIETVPSVLKCKNHEPCRLAPDEAESILILSLKTR